MKIYTKEKKMIVEIEKNELKEVLNMDLETFTDIIDLYSMLAFNDKFIKKVKKPKLKNKSFLAKVEGDLIVFREVME